MLGTGSDAADLAAAHADDVAEADLLGEVAALEPLSIVAGARFVGDAATVEEVDGLRNRRGDGIGPEFIGPERVIEVAAQRRHDAVHLGSAELEGRGGEREWGTGGRQGARGHVERGKGAGREVERGQLTVVEIKRGKLALLKREGRRDPPVEIERGEGPGIERHRGRHGNAQDFGIAPRQGRGGAVVKGGGGQRAIVPSGGGQRAAVQAGGGSDATSERSIRQGSVLQTKRRKRARAEPVRFHVDAEVEGEGAEDVRGERSVAGHQRLDVVDHRYEVEDRHRLDAAGDLRLGRIEHLGFERRIAEKRHEIVAVVDAVFGRRVVQPDGESARAGAIGGVFDVDDVVRRRGIGGSGNGGLDVQGGEGRVRTEAHLARIEVGITVLQPEGRGAIGTRRAGSARDALGAGGTGITLIAFQTLNALRPLCAGFAVGAGGTRRACDALGTCGARGPNRSGVAFEANGTDGSDRTSGTRGAGGADHALRANRALCAGRASRAGGTDRDIDLTAVVGAGADFHAVSPGCERGGQSSENFARAVVSGGNAGAGEGHGGRFVAGDELGADERDDACDGVVGGVLNCGAFSAGSGAEERGRDEEQDSSVGREAVERGDHGWECGARARAVSASYP